MKKLVVIWFFTFWPYMQLFETEAVTEDFIRIDAFGQITYWERQEVRIQIPADGKYFIVVMDEKNQEGKYSLAIGTIEDFSGENILTILPKAWFDTKLFVNDYFSIGILFSVLAVIPVIPTSIIIRKRKRTIKNISTIN